MQIEVVALGGYKARLEERVNAILGVSALSWERRIAPAIGHHVWTNRLLDALFMVVMLISWSAAFWAAVSDDFAKGWRPELVWGLGLFLAISVVCLVIGYGEMFRTHGRAYDLARAAEKEDPSLGS